MGGTETLSLKRPNPRLQQLHTHYTDCWGRICHGGTYTVPQFYRRQFSVGTDLLKPTILLHQWWKHTGAAGWRGLHIVVSEAAEEGAEDATTPLLLQADAALRS